MKAYRVDFLIFMLALGIADLASSPAAVLIVFAAGELLYHGLKWVNESC